MSATFDQATPFSIDSLPVSLPLRQDAFSAVTAGMAHARLVEEGHGEESRNRILGWYHVDGALYYCDTRLPLPLSRFATAWREPPPNQAEAIEAAEAEAAILRLGGEQ